MLLQSRLTKLLLAITLSLSAAVASAAEPFKVCWSIYVGWMPWGYGAEQKIVDKWAKKYGIDAMRLPPNNLEVYYLIGLSEMELNAPNLALDDLSQYY